MKNKTIPCLIAVMSMSVSMIACGSTPSTSTTPAETPVESSVTVDSEPVEEESTSVESEVASSEAESADDGVINYTSEDGTLVYTKHEVVKDYNGDPALIVYFDYTNHSDDSASAVFSFDFKLFQNGIQCDTAILDDSPEEYNNGLTEIKPDVTLPVAFAYSLKDETSDVELEVSDLISFDDNKDTQILKLQ